MIETKVESIRVSLLTQNRVVILKEVDGDRHLPIWIGTFEAEAIATELQGIQSSRPLPYDLLRALVERTGSRVEQILIAELNELVFYARIVLEHDGRSIEIDARPSDAIALAVRVGARIMVDESIMSEVGVAIDDDEDRNVALGDGSSGAPGIEPVGGDRATGGEDQLSVFRDFINSLDLDDFDKKRSG